jgi:cytochrome o ubiquinol oxidase subunit 1
VAPAAIKRTTTDRRDNCGRSRFGGLTGVLLALPAVDWQVHNSVFLVAHFHHVIIPGVLFGCMAGYNYWFPKAFGFRLEELTS